MEPQKSTNRETFKYTSSYLSLTFNLTNDPIQLVI